MVPGKGKRNQVSQRGHLMVAGVRVEQKDQALRREFDEELSAQSARSDSSAGRNGDRFPVPYSRRNRRSGRDSFGTNRRAIRGILDIAAAKDSAVTSKNRGPDKKMTVGGIGLFSRLERGGKELRGLAAGDRPLGTDPPLGVGLVREGIGQSHCAFNFLKE